MTTIAFLDIVGNCGKEETVGAVLVLNEHGIPEEFRCTDPIITSNTQRIIYGVTLKPYLGVTICAKPLIDSLTSRPAFIVIRKKYLFNLRLSVKMPVFLLRRAGELIKIEKKQRKGENKYEINSQNTNFQPINFTPHPQYGDDFKANKEIVKEFFNAFDLFEPFDRLSKAVKLIKKQKEN